MVSIRHKMVNGESDEIRPIDQTTGFAAAWTMSEAAV